MNDILTILFNNNPKLEYDHNKPLPDHQALYLDKMNEKMGKGISIGGEQIETRMLNSAPGLLPPISPTSC